MSYWHQTLALALVGSLAALTAAEEKPATDYIHVEIRGELETNIIAIGGESTGTLIRSGNVTWELDLGKNPMLRDLAQQLHKKLVLITGSYHQVKGVEIPVRHIVKVETLKAAESK